MHDDVEPVLDGLQERGRGDRVVDDGRDPVRVRHLGDGGEIDDVPGRVPDALAEHRLRPTVDELGQIVRAVALREADFDPLLRQHVGEERVRAAVELGDGNDVVPRGGEVEDRVS